MKNKYLLVILLIAAVGGTIGTNIAKDIIRQFNKKSISIKNWNIYKIGTSGLRIELPGKPDTSPLNLPDSVRNLIRNTESFQFKKNNIEVGINYVLYIDSLHPEPRNAALGSIQNIKTLNGVKDVNYSFENTIHSNFKEIVMRGNFLRFNKNVSFANAIIARNSEMWSIQIIYTQDIENAEVIIQKIFNSINIHE
ncbi:MAG: hypothetical protein AUJ85_10920 [Elusimicrobia bacterium CG1_02_37_114]|nr:MAG: hypothetical protein AUJ85_10920 [Elusimicrobia bacterium CG1_02_37_114]PIV52242.1 MAG: hypothetical protein COS17_10120 [Elusimicrobia bacterium CG02_land_8_20_14_3_00_37_13]PIZ13441.1 MAG: hypothetical protein COY53_04780 [Elusimicrobia bacterium CG_4_10_14_0_8_um_filter_37_32]